VNIEVLGVTGAAFCLWAATILLSWQENRTKKAPQPGSQQDNSDGAHIVMVRSPSAGNDATNDPHENDKQAQHLHQMTRQTNAAEKQARSTKCAVYVAAAALFVSVIGAGALFSELSAAWQSAGSAKTQAREAMKQTNIQSGLARPIFFLSFTTVKFGGQIFPGNPKPDIASGHNLIFGPTQAEHVETADFNIIGEVRNFGNIPASVDEGGIWFYVGHELPKQPIYKSAPLTGWDSSKAIFPGPYDGAEFDQRISTKENPLPFNLLVHIFQRFPDGLDAASVRGIRGDIWSRQKSLFVYGIVRYSDQLGNRWEFGFGRSYIPQKGSFEKTGGNAYNFDHLVEPVNEPHDTPPTP
jgi:hypothetical protein